MANVITQFLIGLGISYSSRGADRAGRDIDDLGRAAEEAGGQMDNVGDSLDRSVRNGVENSKSRIASLVATFKSAGLAMSGTAALVGTAWAFESKKAQDAYNLNNALATSQFNAPEVYGLGALAEQRGGDRQTTQGSLLAIERGINRIQTGDAGLIQQLAVAGVRVNNPTGRTREDIYGDIAGQFQRLNTTQQSNVAETLGLDPATVRVWQEFGSTTLDVAKAKASELNYTEQHNAALTAINQTILDTQQKLEGLGNSVADVLAPNVKILADELLTLATGVAGWMSEHRELINSIATGSWYDTYIAGSADKAASWVGDKTGFDPRNIGEGTQKSLDTTGESINNSIINGAVNSEKAPPWALGVSASDSSAVNDGTYAAEASPVTNNYAQQSQQLSNIMQSVNRPIQLHGNFSTQGDVILDGDAIGRYAVNHLETKVYPQAIDDTAQRSY